jgi:hypothetical protein
MTGADHDGNAKATSEVAVVPIGGRHRVQCGPTGIRWSSRSVSRRARSRHSGVSRVTSQGRVASRAARVGAGIVASGAAALSFRGTADYAEKSHAVDPGWGWIVPLVVEAGVLTAAAIAWVRSGDGMTARVETTVMASLLTLSVVINVAHAATTTLLGHVVAATPPLVLLVAVEGLLREQRRVARLRSPVKVGDGALTPRPQTSDRSPMSGSTSHTSRGPVRFWTRLLPRQSNRRSRPVRPSHSCRHRPTHQSASSFRGMIACPVPPHRQRQTHHPSRPSCSRCSAPSTPAKR